MPQHYGTPLELFRTAYRRECHVTELIRDICKKTLEANDYTTGSLFRCYIDEQVKEENTVLSIISQLRVAGEKGVYPTNTRLSKR